MSSIRGLEGGDGAGHCYCRDSSDGRELFDADHYGQREVVLRMRVAAVGRRGGALSWSSKADRLTMCLAVVETSVCGLLTRLKECVGLKHEHAKRGEGS